MKKTYIAEMIVICGASIAGSVVGSLIIGILGVFLAMRNYPNVELERGAAIVGAFSGSFLSIPTGFVAGLLAGPLMFFPLLKRNVWRPTVITSVSAFVTAAIISGVILVPIGLFFFALGHI